ncbi:hypothetical protein RR48_09008 [Papilio machaon]|uniref:Uncharacterized protein n=1 Tax=Papilio machaon TaxID=76193 RepID=A0A194QXT1_PAPMA|nr:hypothetical protein RR48_09008 [Papilio machaon]
MMERLSNILNGRKNTNGRGILAVGEEDLVDITAGLQQAAASRTAAVAVTPTSHGTFQLYDHSARPSDAANNLQLIWLFLVQAYVAQFFNLPTGKDALFCGVGGCLMSHAPCPMPNVPCLMSSV